MKILKEPKYFKYFMMLGIMGILIVQFVLKIQYGMNFLVLFIFTAAAYRKDGLVLFKDWWKYIGLFYAYEIGRANAFDFGQKFLNTTLQIKPVLELEKKVFFFLDDIPNVLLQKHLHPVLSNPDWYDYGLFVFYSVFFFIWAVTAYVLWLRKRELFRKYFTGLLALSFFSVFIFTILPTAPPWYASEIGLIDPPIERVLWSFEYLPGLDLSSINKIGQNEFAAVPSLHTAWALYASLYWIKAFSRKSHFSLIFPAGIAFATWYGAEHYIIDSIIGAIFAVVFFFISINWFKITDRVKSFFKVVNKNEPKTAV